DGWRSSGSSSIFCLSRLMNGNRSTGLAQLGPFGSDTFHQVVPRLDEGFGALFLELFGERVDVDSGAAELREHLLAIAAVRRQRRADLAVVGERMQSRLGYRVDGEGRGQRLDVEHVGSPGVLGAGTGPEQALGTRAEIVRAEPSRRDQELARGFEGAPCYRDAELVAQGLGHLAGHRDIPAADEQGGDR